MEAVFTDGKVERDGREGGREDGNEGERDTHTEAGWGRSVGARRLGTVLPCPVLPCLALLRLALPRFASLCFALPRLTLPCPALSLLWPTGLQQLRPACLCVHVRELCIRQRAAAGHCMRAGIPVRPACLAWPCQCWLLGCRVLLADCWSGRQ